MSKNKFHDYTKIGSTAPHAWAVYYGLAIIFNVLIAYSNIFGLISLFFIFLFLAQVVINIYRLIQKTPKLNVKKIVINTVLLVLIALIYMLLKANLNPQ